MTSLMQGWQHLSDRGCMGDEVCTKLTLQDISGDGIRLNDTGKYKLAMNIQQATQDFHPTRTCVHT